MDKKATISLMLKEIEKVIHAAIDTGQTEAYSPLDLIYMAVNEIVNMAQQMQHLEDDFDKNDTGGEEGPVN